MPTVGGKVIRPRESVCSSILHPPFFQRSHKQLQRKPIFPYVILYEMRHYGILPIIGMVNFRARLTVKIRIENR